jgi:hypothetical protein
VVVRESKLIALLANATPKATATTKATTMTPTRIRDGRIAGVDATYVPMISFSC